MCSVIFMDYFLPGIVFEKQELQVFFSILMYFNLKLKRPALQKKQPHSFTISFVCLFAVIHKRACDKGNQVVQFSPLYVMYMIFKFPNSKY